MFRRVKILKDDDIFGELALISLSKRAATITCLTDCHFAILDRKTFRLIQEQCESILDTQVSIIMEIPFFKQISRTALKKYSHYF